MAALAPSPSCAEPPSPAGARTLPITFSSLVVAAGVLAATTSQEKLIQIGSQRPPARKADPEAMAPFRFAEPPHHP
jgi:hypothetical protein